MVVTPCMCVAVIFLFLNVSAEESTSQTHYFLILSVRDLQIKLLPVSTTIFWQIFCEHENSM